MKDIEQAVGHGDDEFGGGNGEGVRFLRERDYGWFFVGSAEVMKMESGVPRC